MQGPEAPMPEVTSVSTCWGWRSVPGPGPRWQHHSPPVFLASTALASLSRSGSGKSACSPLQLRLWSTRFGGYATSYSTWLNFCVGFACMFVHRCMPCVHLPWDWSYRELRATMWILGMKPSALNCGANSPAQYFLRQTMLEIREDTFAKWRNCPVNLGLNS